MKREYSDFKEAVGTELKKLLSNASDQEVQEFIEKEEDEVKYGYERYLNNTSLAEDARFSAVVSSVAYCMFMMYE